MKKWNHYQSHQFSSTFWKFMHPQISGMNFEKTKYNWLQLSDIHFSFEKTKVGHKKISKCAESVHISMSSKLTFNLPKCWYLSTKTNGCFKSLQIQFVRHLFNQTSPQSSKCRRFARANRLRFQNSIFTIQLSVGWSTYTPSFMGSCRVTRATFFHLMCMHVPPSSDHHETMIPLSRIWHIHHLGM